MRYHTMKKYNRTKKQNRRYTAQSCKDILEGLKIPEYIDRAWSDQLHFNNIDPEEERTYGITTHARTRMSQRGISKNAMAVVLMYGRRVHIRNAIVYFFGRKEFNRYFQSNQIAGRWSSFRDIHVLVSPNDDTIITTYKNQKITMKVNL